MKIKELLSDKSLKPAQKTEILANWLLNTELSVNDLIQFAKDAREADKATCIEALEYASKKSPEIIDLIAFQFVTVSLTEKPPRIKWESARVIGNSAHLFPEFLPEAVSNLLVNSEHSGTVVRWSTAFALGEILKLKTIHNIDLLPVIDTIITREEKNSIRKIYLDAIKKARN